jgi:DNA polymerase-3 subunit delta
VPSKPAKPLCLVYGEDDFAVKERARALYKEWCDEIGGMDNEVIDAAASNSSDALKAIGRLREALNTLPFFGGGKAIWFQDCSFLGDDRTSASEAVTSTLSELAAELARFDWQGVRLLVSAGRVDKRRSFYKTLDKSGSVEYFAALGELDGWHGQAEALIRDQLKARDKSISDEAVLALIASVGPNRRHLVAEVEKVGLLIGDRKEVGRADVESIVSRHKQAEPFALIEAVSRRNLAVALRCLDEELWEMQSDKK